MPPVYSSCCQSDVAQHPVWHRYGPAHNQRQSLTPTEKDVVVKIAIAALMIVFLLALVAGFAASLVAVLLGESKATVVEWGGKSAVCVATLGLAAAGLILFRA